jgi:subtilisin family serine protease
MGMEQPILINKPPSRRQGCGLIVLLGFFSIWVIGLSGLDLFMSWTIEQSLFNSSVGIADLRWIIELIYSVLVFIPNLVLFLLVKTPRVKLVLRLWMLASIFAMLTVPLKTLYLTNQNETSILQISAMLLLIVGGIMFRKSKNPERNEEKENPRLTGLAALLSLGLAIPWILWGAFGSILDTILALGVGIVFGILIVNTIFPYYLEKTQHMGREIKISDFIFDGFVVAVFLLILTAALSHNGSQQLLVITVPISGWILTALSLAAIGKRGEGRAVVGLVAALIVVLPLVFFDMDELSLVIASSPGEVISWANKAAWFTFMSLIMLTIVLLINFKVILNLNLPKKWNWGLSIASLVSIVVAYLVWGQIGFFGDKIFVILKSQADLTTKSEIVNYEDRRKAVYDSLVDYAVNSQANLRTELDRLNLSYTPYYLLNAIEVDGGNIAKLLISKNESIDRILDSPQLRPLPQTAPIQVMDVASKPTSVPWNLKMIQSDRVNDELNITGKGIIIGQTDSGIDGRHVDLFDAYRGKSTNDDYNWYDPWNHSTFPIDGQGHGTQTLGVILGKTTGVARDAQWIGCINLARNLGNPARYLDCMQFMLAPFPQDGNAFTDGKPEKGAMIINNSWGCPRVEGCDTIVYISVVEALKTAGIFLSAAAGNTGYYGCATITDPPAIYADVFTSGSVNQSGDLSDFSSLGPVLVDGSDRSKPDLLAPGEEVISTFPGDSYVFGSGTSFSAPHVTGVVALMWSANPKLIGNIEATSRILRDSTQSYSGIEPDCGNIHYGSGTGILDAFKAVEAAIQFK